jgi:oligopeptide transport system substrate-binding protein
MNRKNTFQVDMQFMYISILCKLLVINQYYLLGGANKMAGKKLISVLLIAVLALGLAFTTAGCAGSSGGNQVLRVNDQTEPGTLHPGKAETTNETWILDHVFEGLMKKDVNGNNVPGMAKEYKMSDDGMTYTFTLRDGIKWSNGDAVIARDFEYAWKYALDPATASPYSYVFYYIKGGEAYNTADEATLKDEAKLKALRDAVGVKALDDKTLEVKLQAPTAFFLDLCSFASYVPVDSKVQEANKDWANDAKTFVSNGPFKLTEWQHKSKVVIMKNENYYDKDKIKLSEIDFAMIEDEATAWQMYKSGQLDLGYTLPVDVIAQLKSDKSAELHIAPDLSFYYYEFNNTKKPFTNLKIRQALSLAIDRKAIVENVTQGGQTPAYGVVPPGIVLNGKDYRAATPDKDYFQEDLAKAKQLLAEGLKEEGLTNLKFTLLYNTLPSHKKVAEAIQDMWKKNLGVDISLENVEMKVKRDREKKFEYDVCRSGWQGDYIDPMTFMDFYMSDNPQNNSGYKNPEYDKLIKAANETNDNAKRTELFQKAEKILMADMPVMPIYYYTKPYALKSHVKGVYEIVNRYPQMQYAYIEK